MDSKKPIILNDLEEWDFTDYIDSLIQKETAVGLEFKTANSGTMLASWQKPYVEESKIPRASIFDKFHSRRLCYNGRNS